MSNPNPSKEVGLSARALPVTLVRYTFHHMSSSTARPRGRPAVHVLSTEPSSRATEHVDIGIYPSSDGRRVVQDAASPPRKKRRVHPSDLDDEFAQWDPGNGGDEAGDLEGEGGDMDGPSAVVSNLEPLATRQRYLSSVRFYPF